MEAKRRKLSPNDSPGTSSARTRTSASSSPTQKSVAVTVEQLKSKEPGVQAAALKTLKKQINTKAAVQSFVDAKSPNGRFFAVLDILGKRAAELYGDRLVACNMISAS